MYVAYKFQVLEEGIPSWLFMALHTEDWLYHLFQDDQNNDDWLPEKGFALELVRAHHDGLEKTEYATGGFRSAKDGDLVNATGDKENEEAFVLLAFWKHHAKQRLGDLARTPSGGFFTVKFAGDAGRRYFFNIAEKDLKKWKKKFQTVDEGDVVFTGFYSGLASGSYQKNQWVPT